MLSQPADMTPPHLGGHCNITNMDTVTLDYLIERYGVKTMLDVGCGPGGMVAAARERGVAASGIDGDPAMWRPDIIIHDYTIGPLGFSPVDLIWCVEFVEHVEKQYVNNFLATFKAGRVLFLSHAVPGQEGYHHVNCQPDYYWVDKIYTLGFKLDADATDWARRHAANVYTRATGMVFVR